MNRFLFAILSFGILSLALSDSCLELNPSLSEKTACANSPISCESGTYCDSKGFCSKYKAAGDACQLDFECGVDQTCKGAPGAKKCVVNANPGEACNGTLTVDTPSCGDNLSCFEGRCVGGSFGDKCLENSDCSFGLNCTAEVCKGASANAECSFFIACDTGLFCDNAVSPSICKPLLTGGKCSSASQCAYGYACIGASPTDATQCVQWGTRKVGEYCSNPSLSKLCEESMRCYAGYCASESTPKYCSSGSECSADEACTCNSRPLVEGTGRCTKNPCFELSETYQECLTTKCSGNFGLSFAKSCVNINCRTEYDSLRECNPAVRAAISFLILAVSFVALFF